MVSGGGLFKFATMANYSPAIHKLSTAKPFRRRVLTFATELTRVCNKWSAEHQLGMFQIWYLRAELVLGAPS
jgi:hypothetical protein